jgi:phosphoribosylformylglycinamidine synthase
VTDAPHVILGAKEDAGIVAIAQDQQGYRYGLVVSHESHNHPSQIVLMKGRRRVLAEIFAMSVVWEQK